jgi:hypothetical protein
MSGTGGNARRRAGSAALVGLAALAIAGCSTQVTGTARPAGAPARSSAPSAGTTASFNLCTLLSWQDLGYPGVEGARSPSQSGNQPGWSQYCLWQSQQFNAGYRPPPDPKCNSENSSNFASAVQCMDANTKELTAIESNSHVVNVAVGWKPGHKEVKPTSHYVRDGITVYLDDASITETCIGDLHWAGGVLQVEVQDGTKAYGTPCAQATRFVNLLITRQPH